MNLRLKEIRKERGLKGVQMAARMGVSQPNYSAWENGKTSFTLEQACQLADILHCTLDELAGRKMSLEPQVESIANEWRSMNGDGRAALEMTAHALASMPCNRKSCHKDVSEDREAV